jgi:hypothetical protein
MWSAVSCRALSIMLATSGSHPIDIDGVFVGAAVRLDQGYRFIATNMRLEELDQSIWPTLTDVQRVVRHLYLNGILPARNAPRVSAGPRIVAWA